MTTSLLWRCANHLFNCAERTLVMGILNVTPDSFSNGGRYNTVETAFDRAVHMQEEGADIIDIGGESTRPGAAPISEQQESARVLPVIEKCRAHLNIPISIDTYKSTVARQALAAGAVIVNDISGCRFDAEMPHIVRQYNAGLVIMHIKGEPKNMQVNPHYDDLFDEIARYFEESFRTVRAAGVSEEQIVIDPGIGFGKRLKDNFQILRELRILQRFGRPILVGPSRKSFIGRLLNLSEDERLEGTIAAVAAAVLNGAHIVRVHDVQEIKRAVMIADAIAGKIKVGD